MTPSDLLPRIEFTQYFETQLKLAPDDVKVAFRDTLQLFRADAHHESLRNHALKDRFARFPQHRRHT
jgi:hypothetical protein